MEKIKTRDQEQTKLKKKKLAQERVKKQPTLDAVLYKVRKST